MEQEDWLYGKGTFEDNIQDFPLLSSHNPFLK